MNDQVQRMSDNQRRFFCRVVFIFACFLPTFIAAYVILHQPTKNDWIQIIQSRLPLKVDIASVETPVPNRVVLRGLSVLPSDGQLFPELEGFEADEVTIDYLFSHNEISFVHPVEVELQSLASLLTRLATELDEAELNNERWKISFSKVAIVDRKNDNQDFLFKPLTVSLQRSAADESGARSIQAQLLAKTEFTGDKNQLAIQFEKLNGHQLVSVDARNCFLPSNLIQNFLDGAPIIGQSSFFTGQLEFQSDAQNRTSGQIVGELQNVHLDEFQMGENQLTGICSIRDLYCSFNDGRIESAKLHFTSDNPITFNKQFVNEMTEFGIWVRDDQLAERVSISQLDLGVTLHHGSILLYGRKGYVEQDGQRFEADCIAFRDFDQELHTVAVCNSKQSIPIVSLAKLMTGNEIGNQTLQFLDRFSIPSRTANGRDGLGLH